MTREQTYEVEFCNSPVTLTFEAGSDSVELSVTISGTATWTGADPTLATEAGEIDITRATVDAEIVCELAFGAWVTLLSDTHDLAPSYDGSDECNGIDWTDALDEIRCLVEEVHGDV